MHPSFPRLTSQCRWLSCVSRFFFCTIIPMTDLAFVLEHRTAPRLNHTEILLLLGDSQPLHQATGLGPVNLFLTRPWQPVILLPGLDVSQYPNPIIIPSSPIEYTTHSLFQVPSILSISFPIHHSQSHSKQWLLCMYMKIHSLFIIN